MFPRSAQLYKSPKSPSCGRLPPEGAPVSAAEALKAARDAGIRLAVDGDDLVLKGSAPPPPRVFELLG